MCDYVGNLSYYLVADIRRKVFIRKAATMVDELFGCCTGGEIRGFRVFVVVVCVCL